MTQQSADERRSARAPKRSMADVLALPDEQRSFVLWLLRHPGSNVTVLCEHTGLSERELRILLATLEEQGFLRATVRAGTESFATVLVAPRRRGIALDL